LIGESRVFGRFCFSFSLAMNVEQIQRLHYDRIGAQYESHYGDVCSRQYRDRFIHLPMFEGLNLRGMNVLEAMCGNGQTTEFLLSKGARVTGLDISPTEMGSFRQRWPNCEARCASILDSGFPSNSFDCVAIVGGLHHLHPHVVEAVGEIHRILKAGGSFCFAEPYRGSLPDLVRSFWYKHDRLFASNEASIDLREIKENFGAAFSFDSERYLGNVGYLLVLNSMVFRIPVRFKRWYTPTVLWIESVLNRLQGKSTACFVVSRLQKK
jgi:SAM-dependent methyltransferase